MKRSAGSTLKASAMRFRLSAEGKRLNFSIFPIKSSSKWYHKNVIFEGNSKYLTVLQDISGKVREFF
jgi:hypothetical protein